MIPIVAFHLSQRHTCMLECARYLALVTACLLIVGETLVLLRTNKYWPLSVDDYLACTVLLYAALTLEHPNSQLLMLLAWSFMAGNLYAMLFTRLDPVSGTRERVVAVGVLLIASLSGTAITSSLLMS